MTKIKKIHPLYLFAGLAAFLTRATPALADTTVQHTVGQPYPWEMVFQGSASPVRDQTEHFHDAILMPIITAITVIVLGLLLYIIFRFNAKRNPVPSKTTHNTPLEIIWTLIPVVILVGIAFPSMKLLYFADKTTDAGLTVKVTGSQWYWSYEYPDNGDVSILSNYIHDKDIDKSKGELRLLSVDNPLVVPVDTNVRVLIGSTDVIHSWSVPAFGVKLDAVPGRTNETWFRAEKTGTFYGQCSQLCGAGHGYMPIEVKAVSKEDFAKFIQAQGGKMPTASADAASEKAAADKAAADKAVQPVEAAVKEVKAVKEAVSKKAGEK